MASGIFLIFDDIAALMDDVAVTTKVATTKTASILGDDLAVSAEQTVGHSASRELPVLWAITKGSFLNKLIIIPFALLFTAFFPYLIKWILVAGGIYLAYEGVEKIIEFLFHKKHTAPVAKMTEKAKIKSAIMTDFILSIEIVIIALGTVLDKSFLIQVAIVSIIGILATVGVYGVVALIVRMDDLGLRLISISKGKNDKLSHIQTALGKYLVMALPLVIKILGIVGTFALLLVSGGIFIHHLEFAHHLFPNAWMLIREFLAGFVTGFASVLFVNGIKYVRSII